jgi:hypothetical protein
MPKGISLHIGVLAVDPNHYCGWAGELSGCERDAEDMELIAKATGFETHLLRTRQATRRNVHEAISKASRQLKEADTFFLTFSGHGGQVEDTNGDERRVSLFKTKDETWCLFDGQQIDDERAQLLAEFAAGVRVISIIDACHSGTSLRLSPADSLYDAEAYRSNALAHELEVKPTILADLRKPPFEAKQGKFDLSKAHFRYMPTRIAENVNSLHSRFYKSIQDEIDPNVQDRCRATVLSISACQDSQVAMDGVSNGLFTSVLCEVWNDGKFQGDYDAFYQEILKRMPENQRPYVDYWGRANPMFRAQRPFTV